MRGGRVRAIHRRPLDVVANVPGPAENGQLPVRAAERLPHWVDAWRGAGKLVLLLDFDGTLAPIVARPDIAEVPARTRSALQALRQRPDVDMAVISGRGLADVRERVAIEGIAYAGNHGMEIEGPGVARVHREAQAARPALEQAAAEVSSLLEEFGGAWIEDKGLTLSVHYRALPDEQGQELRDEIVARVGRVPNLHLTHGKKVLEIRPRVDWHKGRAVSFLLDHLQPAAEAPVLYFGDDTTDEDAFQVLQTWREGGGEGVLVAERPRPTAARSFVRTPEDMADLLADLAAARLPGSAQSR